MRLFLSLAFAALMAGAAVAAEPAPPATPTSSDDGTISGVTVTGATPTEAADDPVVCRRAPETGSRVRARKECRKKSEWAAKSRARSRNSGQEIKMGDCGGGGAACELTPLPPT